MAMRRWLAAGLVLAAVVPLGACSKSDGPAPATTTAAPGTTAGSVAPGSTRAPGTTAAGGSSGTTASTPGSTPAEAAAYCTVVRSNEQLVQNGFADPAKVGDFLAVLGQMEEAAPAAQKANVAAVRTVADGLAGLSPAEADRKMFDLLQQPGVLEAAASLSDFTEQACGVQLQSTSAQPSTGTGDNGGSGSGDPTGGGGSATPTLDDLKSAVQDAAGGAPWYKALNGWGIGSVNGAGDISITADSSDTPLDKEGAVAACSAAAAWGAGRYGSVKVVVLGPNQAVLASKDASASSCTPG